LPAANGQVRGGRSGPSSTRLNLGLYDTLAQVYVSGAAGQMIDSLLQLAGM
jgi:hypothetical protein